MSDVTIDDGKITCCLCGARTHIIQAHLKEAHSDMTLDTYRSKFPESPILSPRAIAVQQQKQTESAATAKMETVGVVNYAGGFTSMQKPMHELFGLGRAAAAFGHKKNPIPINVISAPAHLQSFVPKLDANYIWTIDTLKTVLMGSEMRLPTYLWGHAGTGKTTVFEQVMHHTGRPMLRVQHSRTTEESHVVGQWTVRDGETVFELGPLAYCMKHGMTYLADEYDFAMPGVLSVYQPVLEGKPLVIKEADAANRVIEPHPLFRFVATGNTNGQGDETGLYQGTMMQNAANYERFAIVEEVRYPERKIEISIVTGQGSIPAEDAEKLVDYGTLIREAFSNGKIGLPVSPRALINAAILWRKTANPLKGVSQSYINRLSRVDQEVARETFNRMGFPGA